jgi:hypothetical protein
MDLIDAILLLSDNRCGDSQDAMVPLLGTRLLYVLIDVTLTDVTNACSEDQASAHSKTDVQKVFGHLI